MNDTVRELQLVDEWTQKTKIKYIMLCGHSDDRINRPRLFPSGFVNLHEFLAFRKHIRPIQVQLQVVASYICILWRHNNKSILGVLVRLSALV